VISAIISLVATALQAVVAYLQKKRDDLLVGLGASQQSNSDLKGRIDGIIQAKELGEAADADAERNPDGILSDDGFQRKDD
jgi:hypothetical protein